MFRLDYTPGVSIIKSSLVDLPSPANISYFWNFGSLLGLCLATQIVSGLFLAFHYASDVSIAFDSVILSSKNVSANWLLRMVHCNGASFFFMCLYLHVGRGLYYGSFYFKETWNLGVIILLLVMATAFLGYVLPWGQMSFWGATVITSLFSAIPFVGGDVVIWLWGGFSVDNATLNRFFGFHFLLPFIISFAVGLHLLFLHKSGSGNPLGVSGNLLKVPFHSYFSSKDLLGFIIFFMLLGYIVFFAPWGLGDPENFVQANPMVTPAHIQPEWYFLFAYAILRAIPNKLGGVVALAMAILILLVMPFMPTPLLRGNAFYPLSQARFWLHCANFCLLTWIGACPVEEPYILTSQILGVIYFSFYFEEFFLKTAWDKLVAHNF